MSEDKKAKAKEYQSRYYQKNKDKCLEMVKDWKEKNPEKSKQMKQTYYYEKYKSNKEADGLTKYEKHLTKWKEKYNSDPEYREKLKAKVKAYRSTDAYKIKKKQYNQTAKYKANQKKHQELRKQARANATREKEELQSLLTPIKAKEAKPIKKPKLESKQKPNDSNKSKANNVVKLVRILSLEVKAPNKPLSTKEIWLKKKREQTEKIKAKEKNHINVKEFNKDPYAGMTLTKSIKVKV